jgi:hypothetical protein
MQTRRLPGTRLSTRAARGRIDRHFELLANVSNAFDKSYETYGPLAPNMFPDAHFCSPRPVPATRPPRASSRPVHRGPT